MGKQYDRYECKECGMITVDTSPDWQDLYIRCAHCHSDKLINKSKKEKYKKYRDRGKKKW